MVRIGIALKDDELTSFSVSTESGFRYGYINKNTDEFVGVGRVTEAQVTAQNDNRYYVEISSFKSEGTRYSLVSDLAVSTLNSLIGSWGLTLIPAYNDDFCYRLGPFEDSASALPCMQMLGQAIEAKNNSGYSLDIGYSIIAPSSSSVLLVTSNHTPIYSFSTSGETMAMAVEPVSVGGSLPYIYANSQTYPGIFEFRRNRSSAGDFLFVINILQLETYVACVDSYEIYDFWPLEAHKVFSTIVRTFTVRSGEKHASQHADLCSGICCQVYNGIDRVNETIREAVNSTAGTVLSYDGSVAKVYYAAVSGGSTVSCAESWSDDVPYLLAVATPWEKYKDISRYTSRGVWHKEYTGMEIYQKLRSSGKHPNIKGEIVDVHIDSFCTNSCYVYKITFTDIYGNKSSATQADTIRYLLGFDSGNFVVGKNGQTVAYPEYSLDCYPSVYAEEGSDYGEYLSFEEAQLRAINGDLTISGFTVDQARALLADGTTHNDMTNVNWEILTGGEEVHVNSKGLPDILNAETVLRMRTMTLSGADGKFIFEGRGWGHGIGFSQYGIWHLCEAGYDYETVLSYYLKNVQFSNLADLQ